MPKLFCSTCRSDRFLVHLAGCEAWVIPVEMPASPERYDPSRFRRTDRVRTCDTCGGVRSPDDPDPAQWASLCVACYAQREVEAQTPSPCLCQFCRDGGCRGNLWCHCRDGILYGQIEANNAKITRARKRRTAGT